MQNRTTPTLNLPENSRVHRVAPWVADGNCQQAIATFATRLAEPERRWLAGLLATLIGHGGIGVAAELVEICPDTVSRGKAELKHGLEGCPWGRDRAEGAGRPPIEALRPEIEGTLKELAKPHLYGDPESGRTYCRRSARNLAKDLDANGFPVGHDTVRRLLKGGHSLRANVKRFAGPPHPDRDRQFQVINTTRNAFAAQGLPIISIDAKKKELIGNFANAGQCWRREADEVNAHDFPSDAICRAVPYGIYDVTRNAGLVGIGTSHDTPAFAVDVIVRWWETEGQAAYPFANEILILADAGGSNGCRPRMFKHCLQEELADRFSLRVTVCHYPSGASKWNPIEHRLFGPISLNWSGLPLRSLEHMEAAINGTTTSTGLRVKAHQIPGDYPTGARIPDKKWRQFEAQHITRSTTCPTWNYTLNPSSTYIQN